MGGQPTLAPEGRERRRARAAPSLVHDRRVGHRVDADPAVRAAMADQVSGGPRALAALGRHCDGCRDALQDLRVHANTLHPTRRPEFPARLRSHAWDRRQSTLSQLAENNPDIGPRCRLPFLAPAATRSGLLLRLAAGPEQKRLSPVAPVASVAGGVVVEVDCLKRRFHALVKGSAAGGLGIRPPDRRVTYRGVKPTRSLGVGRSAGGHGRSRSHSSGRVSICSSTSRSEIES